MKTRIIAEAGVNHNGSLEMAIELVDQASEAGADMVKFQCFKASELVTPAGRKAKYQKETTQANESQLEMLRGLELTIDDFKKIHKRCFEKKIGFLSTPFSLNAAKFLYDLRLDTIKISSGDLTDLPLLEYISRNVWHIIFSCGMATLEEIDQAFHVLSKKNTTDNKISLLLCTSQYPTPFNDVHLLSMETLKERYKINIGLSDHTTGIHVPVAAVALGASVIEKHFTLDRSLPGPDHKASIDCDELKKMVTQIRQIELALGTTSKELRSAEVDNIELARKSIMASKSINKGDKLTPNNLVTMRPGTGISPMKWYEILGKEAKQDYNKFDFISQNELNGKSNG